MRGRPERRGRYGSAELGYRIDHPVRGGFAVWYTVWHRRVEAAFERVPVERGRSVHVLRQGVTLDRDSR